MAWVYPAPISLLPVTASWGSPLPYAGPFPGLLGHPVILGYSTPEAGHTQDSSVTFDSKILLIDSVSVGFSVTYAQKSLPRDCPSLGWEHSDGQGLWHTPRGPWPGTELRPCGRTVRREQGAAGMGCPPDFILDPRVTAWFLTPQFC